MIHESCQHKSIISLDLMIPTKLSASLRVEKKVTKTPRGGRKLYAAAYAMGTGRTGKGEGARPIVAKTPLPEGGRRGAKKEEKRRKPGDYPLIRRPRPSLFSESSQGTIIIFSSVYFLISRFLFKPNM